MLLLQAYATDDVPKTPSPINKAISLFTKFFFTFIVLFFPKIPLEINGII